MSTYDDFKAKLDQKYGIDRSGGTAPQTEEEARYQQMRKQLNDKYLGTGATASASPAVTYKPEATTSGGYYTLPELGSEYEALYGNVTAMENLYQDRLTALKNAEGELQKTVKSLAFWQEHLTFLEGRYNSDPSQGNADLYNRAYDRYTQTADSYKASYDAYTAALDAYKPYEAQYNQAVGAYQTYRDQQQALYDNWRGTIRDGAAIQSEMDQLDGQIAETEQEIKNLKILTRFRNDALGEYMRQSLGEAETRLEALEASRGLLQEEYDWSEYFRYADLMDAADFGEKSAYVSTANGRKRGVMDIMLDNYSAESSGWDDPLYEYINGNEEAGAYISNAAGTYGGAYGRATESKTESQQMTEDEVAIFNYLYATQGKEAAHSYYNYLLSDLNYRQRKADEEYWKSYANRDPVGSSVFSVAMAPAKGLSYVGQVGDYLPDGKIDQNESYNKYSYVNSAIRGEVASEIEKSGNWGPVGSFTYQTGMSMADFLVTTAVTGGNKNLAMAIMGTGAAADATIAAKDRGLSDEQAFTLGTVSGLAEMAMEKVSLETLLNPNLLRNGSLKYVLKNMVAEGSEEVGTDLVNLLADILVSKDESQWRQSVDAYMRSGKTEEEAFGLALADQALSMGLDFLGGAISGGIMSGGATVAYNGSINQQAQKLAELDLDDEDVRAFIETGLESDPDSDAYHIARELQKKLDAGQELTAKDLSRIYQANIQAVAEEQRTADTDGAESLSLPTLNDETASLKRGAAERNMNGGTQDVTEEGLWLGAAFDEPADNADRGTGVLHGSGQRDADPGTGEQAGGLAGGAGSAATGREFTDVGQGETAAARQNTARHLRLERVSSLDLGLESGTETRNIQVMPRENWDDEMMRVADRIYDETGKNLTYVMGRIQIRGSGGAVNYVRGVITDDGIIVQADHLRLGIEKIADHEAYHAKVDWAASGGADLNREIRRHIIDTFSEEELSRVLERYIDALWGVIGVDDAAGDEAIDRAMSRVEEELFADAYAGINAFGAGADRFTEAVNEKMDELYMGKVRNQDNGTAEPTGPPAEISTEKENTAGYGGKKYLIDSAQDAAEVYLEAANLTADEAREGEEVASFIHAVNAMIDASKRSKRMKRIGLASKRHVDLINNLMQKVRPGFSAEGYTLWIDGTGANHIELRHGERGKQDRSMASTEAKMLIPWASQNADACNFIADGKGNIKRSSRFLNRDGTRPPEIIMEKKLDHDTVYVSECVLDSSSKRIWITSAYIKKGSTGQKLNMEESSPQPTPEAIFDSSATTDIVATPERSVKERFSYGGENANNADLEALARAKEMLAAGVDEETIRQQTGWHVGMDGKWRWEIDDSGMRYDGSGDLRGAESAKWAREDYESAREDLWGHADLETLNKVRAYNRADIAGDEATKQELYNELMGGPHAYYFGQYVELLERAQQVKGAPVGGTLQDYIDHPALFEAYPQLRNVGLRFERMGGGNMGYYSRMDNEIVLNADVRYAAEDVLVHEIQHAIQKAEGFARGSNVEYWQRRQDGDNPVGAYDTKIRDAEQKISKILDALPSNVADQLRQWSAMDDATPEAMALADELSDGPYGDLFEDYWLATFGAKDMRRTNYKRGPRDLYQNTAGEIEARDAASRRTMTPDQRRTKAPAGADSGTVFVEDDMDVFAELDVEYGPQLQAAAAEFGQDTIDDNIRRVAQMAPVTEISGQEFGKGEVDLITQVETFFNQRRNRAYNQELGEVILDRKGVKSDIAHGIGRKKAAAFAAVPDVIERGLVVDYQKDWKGRGYDTAVVAAPITIGGQEHAAAVILVRSDHTNRFYVHEVLTMENGALPFKTRTREGYPGGDAPSILSILDRIRSVKNQTGTAEKYSVDDDKSERPQEKKTPKKKVKPVAESRPLIAKSKFRNAVLDLFSVPSGSRAVLGAIADFYADRLIKNGALTEEDRKYFFNRMYESGVMRVPADEYFQNARSAIAGGRIFVSASMRNELGDEWNDIRKRAFAAGIYLSIDVSNPGIDSWNVELAELLPGLFDSEETDRRTILERIIRVAEEGKDEKMSLPEYTARLAEQEHVSEDEYLDNMERQLDWTLHTFAENAKLEIQLRDRTGRKIAQERAKGDQRLAKQAYKEAQRRTKEREERKRMRDRKRQRAEFHELQRKTLKQLQWLEKNRHKAPEDLKATWNEVLGDIDFYALGTANEMWWSDKYNATWKDIAQMYKDAKENDPNFMPSKDLERIVARLDGAKIADMDLGALQDLYKAAVGLRTEFYNRNNVINDANNRLFAEVYTDAKREIEAAPGSYTGKAMDKLFNLEQLTPMNVLQRMGGWDPDGVFYSMAKQLELGERDMRAYSVKAQRMLQEFLEDNADWVKIADGQGKDAIWYEVEVPQLLELGMGDKPIFGPTVKVYMTPAQKVHMYLESKNLDNLRHMTGGRTFANRELYSQGKRQEALAQGVTIKLAPETVRKLVSDLTPEEMELARILDRYYNTFATQEINRVSNVLYGYDKAMGKNYAPIYTNRNYTKAEFGVFDTTAEGVGNLKGRQFAVNPSYNISALDAFERHIDQTARFVGVAIPTRNWTTLMNWREKNNSTGDVITHKWGEEGKRYISDLITRLQSGDSAETDSLSSMANKIQSNYISAVFGANPSIVLKQLGSIPLAAAYLDARNVPSMSQIAGIDRDLISKYTQDLEWRTMGYSMPETKHLKDNPNWTQTNKFFQFTFGGGAITAMDGWAASVLWPWAENKVRREFPELELGTSAQVENGESSFYKKVAEVFEDALARSQSTSDEIHQSSLRKSKNPITRAFTMFRSDSAQTYNTLRQKIGEAQYCARTGAKPEVLRAAKKAAGSAVVAMLLNAAWAESVNFLMALWKNKGKHYRDEEDELTAGSVIGEMASRMVGSLAGVVAGGEELAEIIGNLITGDAWYDIEVPGMEQVNDLINTLMESGGGMRDLIFGAVEILKNGGDLGKYFGDRSGDILGNIKTIAQAAASYFAGLPASNVEAYLLGAVKWISPKLGTAYDDLFASVGKNDLVGLEGEALVSRLGRILDDHGVECSRETIVALAALYEAGQTGAMPSDTPSSVSVGGETQALNVYQQQTYNMVWGGIVADGLDELVSSDSFATADPETQAKMLKGLYAYAAERAKAELFDDYERSSSAETIDHIRASGLALADCVAWATETSGLKQAEKFAVLQQWDIPDASKIAIMGTLIGTDMKTESGGPSQYAKMLEALEQGMTMDQYLETRLNGADLDDYLNLMDDGADSDFAYEFANRLEELEREGETVDDLAKWRACVDFSSDVEDQLTALSMVMTDAQLAKAEIANEFGVAPELYVRYHETRSDYDADSNGSYTQKEVKAAIDSMGSSLTTEQKAALWQLANSSTKSSKNNPYSQAVGQRVLDARAAAKEKAAGEDEDETFAQAVQKQLMGR